MGFWDAAPKMMCRALTNFFQHRPHFSSCNQISRRVIVCEILLEFYTGPGLFHLYLVTLTSFNFSSAGFPRAEVHDPPCERRWQAGGHRNADA